jgi:hypothetical protein
VKPAGGKGMGMLRLVALITLCLVATASGVAGQTLAPANTRVRGVIEGFSDEVLKVKAREAGSGSVAVKLVDNYMVLAVTPAALSDIKPGVYLSAAAQELADGTFTAQGIYVYPDVARGINEGHYPYDLSPGSTVTFATVESVVEGANGPTITLKYKGGMVKVAVPPPTPIATFDLADATMLKAGAAVFIPGQRRPDGGVDASRIFVGKDGVVPPM